MSKEKGNLQVLLSPLSEQACFEFLNFFNPDIDTPALPHSKVDKKSQVVDSGSCIQNLTLLCRRAYRGYKWLSIAEHGPNVRRIMVTEYNMQVLRYVTFAPSIFSYTLALLLHAIHSAWPSNCATVTSESHELYSLPTDPPRPTQQRAPLLLVITRAKFLAGTNCYCEHSHIVGDYRK